MNLSLKGFSPLVILLTSLILISGIVPFVAVARGAVHYSDYRVTAGEVLEHPLIVVGGTVTIDGETRAPLLSLGGRIINGGRAHDDLVVVGGTVHLASGSLVEGNVVALGGRIFRSDSATVGGNVAGTEFLWSGAELLRSGDPAPIIAARIRMGLLGMISGVLLAFAATTFLPWPIILSATTASEQPIRSGLVGVTGLACVPLLIIPLALSLVGLPLALFLALALFGAWIIGLATAGLILGRHLMGLWTDESSLLTATMLGLAAIGSLQALPVVGGLMIVLAGGLGAGALALGVTAGELGRPTLAVGALGEPALRE